MLESFVRMLAWRLRPYACLNPSSGSLLEALVWKLASRVCLDVCLEQLYSDACLAELNAMHLERGRSAATEASSLCFDSSHATQTLSRLCNGIGLYYCRSIEQSAAAWPRCGSVANIGNRLGLASLGQLLGVHVNKEWSTLATRHGRTQCHVTSNQQMFSALATKSLVDCARSPKRWAMFELAEQVVTTSTNAAVYL